MSSYRNSGRNNGYSNQNCQYSQNNFRSADDVRNCYQDQNCYDQCDNNMELFCQRQSVSCPVGPDGKMMQVCSNMIATDDSGQVCREWAKKHPEEADKVMKEYCDHHEGYECACVNRSNDPVYRAGKAHSGSTNDACWYKPCQDAAVTLIPSQLLNADCPAGFCNEIVAGIKRSHVDISTCDLEKAISCNFQKNCGPSSCSFGWFWIVLLVILFVVAFVFIACRNRYRSN